jgi:hypothetical protein
VPYLMPLASGSNRPMSPAASSRNVSALQTIRVHAGGGGGGRDEASGPRAPPPSHHGTRARREGWEEDAAELLLSAAATAGVCERERERERVREGVTNTKAGTTEADTLQSLSIVSL